MKTVFDINNDWRRAAERYEAVGRQKQATAATETKPEVPKLTAKEIEQAVCNLNDFFRVQGAAATVLLRESRRHIILGENRCGGRMAEVCYIDASGLHCSIEASGTWVAYNPNVPRPKIWNVTIEEAVQFAVIHGGMKSSEIVDYLIRELNKIAEAAPQV
jgi:hypothetical protein